jgi:hypothetical protein
LTNLTIFKNGGALANLTYTYPAGHAGWIESMTNALSGEMVTYQYDMLSRLTANSQQWTQTYTDADVHV